MINKLSTKKKLSSKSTWIGWLNSSKGWKLLSFLTKHYQPQWCLPTQWANWLNGCNTSINRRRRLLHPCVRRPLERKLIQNSGSKSAKKDINTLSAQLTGVIGEILALSEEDSALLANATTIQGALSELDFEAGRRLYLLEETSKVSEAHLEYTVELPKFSVPTFDRDILNWAVFWEQFQTAIHNNKKLHKAQKLAYLRDAMEKGPAKKVIQGLLHSAGTYLEAVKCLQQGYDRSRFIHQKHMKTIVEAPTVKTVTRKKIRQLHDLVSQHL